MYLFTIFVDNEYTAKKMAIAAKKLGYEMVWQWVIKSKKDKKPVIACDYQSKSSFQHAEQTLPLPREWLDQSREVLRDH